MAILFDCDTIGMISLCGQMAVATSTAHLSPMFQIFDDFQGEFIFYNVNASNNIVL